MPTYFKFDEECLDSIAVILKINFLFKATVHRIISFSVTCNKLLLLLVYQRVTVDPRYLKSYTKIKIVFKNTLSDINSKKHFI